MHAAAVFLVHRPGCRGAEVHGPASPALATPPAFSAAAAGRSFTHNILPRLLRPLSCSACCIGAMAGLRALRAAIQCLLLAAAWSSLAEAGVSFKTLPKTLIVSSRIQGSEGNQSSVIARAGLDALSITWSLNSSFSGQDQLYSNLGAKLCFAPKSQVNRKWRKGFDDLEKDKTCSQKIEEVPYSASGGSILWTVAKNVPKATYFVRIYALDADGNELAFGQTTDKNKTTNLFQVRPISGRSLSIDIAAACFSTFSLVSLATYFFLEQRSAKKKGQL